MGIYIRVVIIITKRMVFQRELNQLTYVADGFIRLTLFLSTAIILAESIFSTFPSATISDENSKASWPFAESPFTWVFKDNVTMPDLDGLFAQDKNFTFNAIKFTLADDVPLNETFVETFAVEDFKDLFDKGNLAFMLTVTSWVCGLWLMMECIVVPDTILGRGVSSSDRLVHLTRMNPLMLMSVFCIIVSTSRVKDVSVLFSVFLEDVEFLQGGLALIKSYLLAAGLIGIAVAFNRKPKGGVNKKWPTPRWYTLPQHQDELKNYQTNPLYFFPFALALSVCPLLSFAHDGYSLIDEFPEKENTSTDFSDMQAYVLQIQAFASTRIVSTVIASILAYDAVTRWLLVVEKPRVHFWMVLGHVYLCMVLSATDNWSDIFDNLNVDLHHISPYLFCVPALMAYAFFNMFYLVEMSETIVFDALILIDANVYYRVFYTLAIALGVIPIVLLFFGWSGPWFDFEMEPGPIMTDIKIFADAVEAMFTEIVNFLWDFAQLFNVCGDGQRPQDTSWIPRTSHDAYTCPTGDIIHQDIIDGCDLDTETDNGICTGLDSYNTPVTLYDTSECETTECTDNINSLTPPLSCQTGSTSPAGGVQTEGVEADADFNDALRSDMGGLGRFVEQADEDLGPEEGAFFNDNFNATSTHIRSGVMQIRGMSTTELNCYMTACDVIVYTVVGTQIAAIFPIPFDFSGIMGAAVDATAFVVEKIAKMTFYLLKAAVKMAIKARRKFKKLLRAKKTIKAFRKLYKIFKSLGSGKVRASWKMLYGFTQNVATSFIAIFLGFWRREKAFPPMPIKFKFVLAALFMANLIMTPILLFLPYSLQQVVGLLPPGLILIQVQITFAWKCILLSTAFALLSTACWVVAVVIETGKEEVKRLAKGIDKLLGVPAAKPVGDRYNTSTAYWNDTFVSWITALVWLLPVVAILVTQFINRDEVMQIVIKADDRMDGPADIMRDLKSIESSLRVEQQEESSDIGGACDLIAKAAVLIMKTTYRTVRRMAFLPPINLEQLFDTLIMALNGLRANIEAFIEGLMPRIDIIPNVNEMLLVLLFACPFGVVLSTIIGFIMSIVPNPQTKALHVFRRNLSWTGLCVSFTVLGIANMISSIKVPIFDISLEVSSVVLTSAFCNVLCLMSYLSGMIDSEIPMLSEGNALTGTKFIKGSEKLKIPYMSVASGPDSHPL